MAQVRDMCSTAHISINPYVTDNSEDEKDLTCQGSLTFNFHNSDLSSFKIVWQSSRPHLHKDTAILSHTATGSYHTFSSSGVPGWYQRGVMGI